LRALLLLVVVEWCIWSLSLWDGKFLLIAFLTDFQKYFRLNLLLKNFEIWMVKKLRSKVKKFKMINSLLKRKF